MWGRIGPLKSSGVDPPGFCVPERITKANFIGGVFFGLGWALIGACPGPMFVLIGHGFMSILIVIGGALLGTLVYGLLRNRLPH